MDEDKKFELGELYKEIRLGRGLKQKDIACKNLTTSQLSRFENGENTLSADRLLLAIDGLNMTISEFGHAFNGYKISPLQRLSTKISYLFANGDVQGLETLLADLSQQKMLKKYDKLNILVLKNAIKTLNADFLVDEKEKEELASYLYSIENWTEYELWIFSNTLSFLSDEDLLFLGKELLARTRVYQELPEISKIVKGALINLIANSIDRGLGLESIYFSDKLDKMLDFHDVFEKIFLKTLKYEIAYLFNDDKNALAELKHFVESLSILEEKVLVNVINQRISKYY